MAAVAAKNILKDVDPRIRPQVETLLKNLKFMEKKLKETLPKMKEADIVIPYDNGGGQTGMRENPAFIAYEKLLAKYEKTLSILAGIIGEEHAAEVSALDTFRARLKVVGQK